MAISFREFDQSDSLSYQGAEAFGDESKPLIADLEVAGFKAKAFLDATGLSIEVELVDDEGEETEPAGFYLAPDYAARALALGLLSADMTRAELLMIRGIDAQNADAFED